MQGTIINYRRGRKTMRTTQMIIEVENVDDKEKASKLVGKSVKYVAPGKNKTTIEGKISGIHGSKGALKVTFEKGMPGQAMATKIEIN
ncbi:50S ribosomal protein L35ae [archaeon]|nr:50S ribosomal protein L35ae [archaeon]MBT4351621.1 50S ribosomal protein L35ae [archaeon]MBT4647831.1 50S ribosomal protein L35ae [archaeon]